MSLKRKLKEYYHSFKAKIKHKKKVKRKLMLHRRWRPIVYKNKKKFIKRKRRPYFKTPYSSNIRHIISKAKELSLSKYMIKKSNGKLTVPTVFSLTDNPKESYDFIFSLYGILYNDATEVVYLDYAQCDRIDLDAQVFMDVLLKDFWDYFKRCKGYGQIKRFDRIKYENFEKDHIIKTLFSIGSFRILKDMHFDFKGVITYKLCVGSKNYVGSNRDRSSQKEIHTTELIDYVIACLASMKRSLTPERKSDLCQVVGEVLINAEEHSTTDHRYSIGYFEENNDATNHSGIFNLVIFNLGETIYEKFKDPNCPTQHIVNRMKALSQQYTQSGFFTPAEFEEETLWTLYSLQEGITSKINYQKRGNGSIRFIESFFNLKGIGLFKDDVSRLVILSGNTKIIFDGSYGIALKEKGDDKFKVISFNNSNTFDDKPDKNFVTFAQNYFPGTIIIAKILIREDDLIVENGGP